MIRAWVGDDRIPNYCLIHQRSLILSVCIRPGRRYVDKDLLGIPGKQRCEVGGKREPDVGVFFFLCRVVMRSSPYTKKVLGKLKQRNERHTPEHPSLLYWRLEFGE